jgi:hypothetical protein
MTQEVLPETARRSGRASAPGLFLPDLIVEVNAFACELLSTYGVLFSRRSGRDFAAAVRLCRIDQWYNDLAVIERGCHQTMAAPLLDFPRDPHFAEKAGRILDLYERIWNAHVST